MPLTRTESLLMGLGRATAAAGSPSVRAELAQRDQLEQRARLEREALQTKLTAQGQQQMAELGVDEQRAILGKLRDALSKTSDPNTINAITPVYQVLEQKLAELTGGTPNLPDPSVLAGTAVEDKPFTLGQGQTRYSASGNPIAQVAPKTTPENVTTVNVNEGNSEFINALGKKEGEAFIEEKKSAEDAVKSLETITAAKKILEKGVISGFAGNFRLNFGKALQQIGINMGDGVDNSQAYFANQAKSVAEIIKAFGSGTGLSDADREYAQKAAAGDISLTEGAMKRILDLNERASRNIIKKYNKKAKQIPEGIVPYKLEIDIPEEDQWPRQVNSVDEALKLPKGTVFIDPDGKKRIR